MCFSLISCGCLLLTSVFVFGGVAVNHTKIVSINHGQPAEINCNYNKTNDTEIMIVNLHTFNRTQCSYYYHLKSWQKQDCEDHVRFIWIPETKEISFELLNLQIHDTDTYICTVKRIAQPPQVDLGINRVQVIVRPVLSLSCVKTHDGSPMILCSVGFSHHPLEQLWIRDGNIVNDSYSEISLNGSFSHKSYLILPSQTLNDSIYFCWVNHSSLNKPLVANLSSSVCYEEVGSSLTVKTVTASVVLVISVVLTVFLIIAFTCNHYRKTRQLSVSPVNVNVTHEPVLHHHLQEEMLYSTLGDHHPVPCSPIGYRSSRLNEHISP